VFCSAEAFKARKGEGHEIKIVKRPSGPISSQYTYERVRVWAIYLSTFSNATISNA
jgi:hypothetical protein